MSYFPDLGDLVLEELQSAFVNRRSAAEHGEEADLWLAEVGIEIAKAGDAGIRFLISCIPDADATQLRAILGGLSSITQKLSARRRTEICNLGRKFLQDPRPIIIAEAVDLLAYHGYKEARADVLGHRNHPSPYVLGAVLRYMRQLFPRAAKPMLVQALKSADPIVRQNGIDELDELGCVDVLPTIKRLTRDKDRDVRLAARSAVKNLKDVRPRSKQTTKKLARL